MLPDYVPGLRQPVDPSLRRVHHLSVLSNSPRLSRAVAMMTERKLRFPFSHLSVANVYSAQPLLDALARNFTIRHAAVGGVVTVTQIGCALALLLLVPLGDRVDRRLLADADARGRHYIEAQAKFIGCCQIFACPADIRKVLHTTNIIDALPAAD